MTKVIKRTIVSGIIEHEFSFAVDGHVDVLNMSTADQLELVDSHEYGVNWFSEIREVSEVQHQIRNTMPLMFYKLHFVTSDYFLNATGNDDCYKRLCSILGRKKFDFVVSEWQKYIYRIDQDLIDSVEYQTSVFDALFKNFRRDLSNDSIYKDEDEQVSYIEWRDCEYEDVSR